MAFESQGIVIKWNGTAIGEVISIGGPSGSAPVIDVSNLASTGAEKLMGLLDEGQITLELNWLPANPAQVALKADRLSRTSRVVQIYLVDTSGTILTMNAYCTGMAIAAGVNTQLKGTITLEIDGNVNHSPPLTVFTAYNPATGVLVLNLQGDTFHADCSTTTNWTWDYDESGLVIATVVKTSDTRATLTYTTGGGVPGSYTMTVQAKAAALVGDFASGILQVAATIPAP